MKKVSTTLTLQDDFHKLISRLIIGDDTIKFNNKVNIILQIFIETLKRTNIELANKFTEEEAIFISSVFEKVKLTTLVSMKTFLIDKLKESIIFKKIEEELSFDEKRFLSKLEALTEYQALCVILMAYRYLAKEEDEDIKQIFLISKSFDLRYDDTKE